MTEHDNTLRQALEENARLRSEHENSLREVASTEYSDHARKVERVYWVYALVCVTLGVAAINYFALSFDTKSLIGAAIGIIVLYETTVLMKLWYATSRMKLDVLKEMKMLRLEVARLQEAAGVEKAPELTARYEPTRATSPLERRLWIAACVVVAMAVSSWTTATWQLGGGGLVTKTDIYLSADGSGEKHIETTRRYSSYYRPSSVTLYVPQDHPLTVLDAAGTELPVRSTSTSTSNNRYEVTLTDGAFVDGELRYTQVIQIPHAAEQKEGVWTCTDGIRTAGKPRPYSITMHLPADSQVLATTPQVEAENDPQGRPTVRFAGTTEDDVQHFFEVRYRLPESESNE